MSAPPGFAALFVKTAVLYSVAFWTIAWALTALIGPVWALLLGVPLNVGVAALGATIFWDFPGGAR